MSNYYVPLTELPEYCCQCPCSTEGSEYDMDSGTETVVYVKCRITEQITVTCAPTALHPEWSQVPRPEDCPIVHWLYISVGDCDDAARC